jgi:TPR repeat protein
MFGIGGEPVNIDKAKAILLKHVSKHPDAGFYLGELIMNNLWKKPVVEPAANPEDPAHPEKHRTSGSVDNPVANALLENLGQSVAEILGENNVPAVLNSPSTKAVIAAATALLAGSSANNDTPENSAGTANEALNFYMQSSQKGHAIAQHRVAHMLAYGIGTPRSCSAATAGFKVLAERGDWMAGLTVGHRAYEAGSYREALSHFSVLASVGVESAQFNAGHILSKKLCPAPLYQGPVPPTGDLPHDDILDVDTGVHIPSKDWVNAFFFNVSEGDSEEEDDGMDSTNCELRAMYLFGLSAGQGAPDSYLRMGDIQYYGSKRLPSNKKEAANYYQIAADMRHTHALFNLGVMHQAGWFIC